MKRIRVAAALLGTVLLVAGCGGGDGGDKPRLVVSAAASLQTAFTQYGKAFEGADARFSFAGSDALAAQIRAGVKPDVFASANTTLPDALSTEQLLESAPVVFASNELVLATRAGTGIRSLKDIERPGVRLAIGTGAVPVGSYTQRVLLALPPARRQAIRANVRSEEPDVTGIVGKLTQKAVDAGFLYATDVKAAKGRLKAIHLPGYLQPVVNYGIAIVKGAREPGAAKAFIHDLLNGPGRDAMAAAGFGPPPSDLTTQRAGL